MLFRIWNYGNSNGLQGGQIGESATIDVAAASLQAASLLAEIDNRNGGQIGGSAAINISASGYMVPLRTMLLFRFLAATVQRPPRSI